MIPLKIEQRTIGPGHPAYIIAELSANHNQNLASAIELIHAAKEAGADAVKLQTYTPDTLTIRSDKPHFRIGKGTLWEGKTLYDLYAEAYTPWEWHAKLKETANDLGLQLFSSPFDESAVDYLEDLGMPAYKIASFELIDVGLAEKVANTGKPIILSTGMATLEEISETVQTIRRTGNEQLALLKCTSAYPAPPESMNLRTIPDLSERFDVPTGLSDHTLGTAVPVAAVTLGACIVEKHFTLSRSIPGPDSAFSLEPHEFKEMVQFIRTAEKALGQVQYTLTEKEEASRVFRRSLFIVKDMKTGEPFTSDNLRSIRPGNGLPPKYLNSTLGQLAARDIEAGTPLDEDFIQ